MRSLTCVAVLFAVALASVGIGQQSLVQSQGQVIVYSGASTTATGDSVPGSGLGELFGASSGLDGFILDDAGNVLFRGSIVDAAGVAYSGSQASFGRGYFYGGSKAGLAKIVRGTDAELSGTIPNAILNTATGVVPFNQNERLAGNGTMMLSSMLVDPVNGTLGSSNNEVLWYGTPGNFQIIARKGDLAPGAGGATFVQAFGSYSLSQYGLNSNGNLYFFGALTGAGVSGTNNNGWFGGTPGNIVLMVRKGDLAPGNEVVSSTGLAISQMNSVGQFVTDVTYVANTGNVPVTSAIDKAVWIYTPGVGAQTLVREGDASPISGAFFASATNGWQPGTGTTSFDSNGRLLCSTTLTGAVTANVDDRAVVILSLAGHSLVYQRGAAAPGAAGCTLQTPTDSSLVLNGNGRVAFEASMAGAVTTADDTGIWTGTPGNLALVCREGDIAPGTGGLTFGHLSGYLTMNGAGQILFQNTLSNGFTSFWSWDPAAGLQCLVRNGDSIEVQPGVFKTVNTLSGGAQNANGNGRPLGFNDAGTAVIRITFSDASSAIVTVRTGSLTGLPAKISEAAGGTHNLYLNAGAAHAGQTYILAGSLSGTAPGTMIGGYLVPLNLDWYTDYMLQNANTLPFVNNVGTLDADGRAQAQVVIPPAVAGIAGVVVHHAFGVMDALNNVVFVSEAARLEIIP